MLKIVAKVLNFKVDWWDYVTWWAVLIPVFLFAVWYFMTASDPEGQDDAPWKRASFKNRFYHTSKDGKRHLVVPYILALTLWPLMAAIANLSKVAPWLRIFLAIGLMAIVVNEMFRNVNRFWEYVPLVAIMAVDWFILSAATFAACEGGRNTIAEKGWPTFWQLALNFVPFLMILLLIGCIIANILMTKQIKHWWLPKLIALFLAIIWLIVLAIWLGTLKSKNESGTADPTGDPTKTVATTDTPTPTTEPDNGATNEDKKVVERIMTSGDEQLDMILRAYGFHLGMKINKNSYPSKLVDKSRLFEDAVSVPYSSTTPDGMVKETYEEMPNPAWLRALSGYMAEVPALSEFTCFKEYNKIYDDNGIEYFLEEDGETLTRQYAMYVAIHAYFLSRVTDVYVTDIPGTTAVWRLAKGNILTYKDGFEDGEAHVVLDLGITKKDNYNEQKQYCKVLVMHHGDKDEGYDVYLDIFDKAPVIPKETPKPKPTATPTPKPTSTPTPRPTSTPTPKPTSTPTPRPTSTPTPKPTSTPTPRPTSTPTPKPTNTPTPTPTATPTPTPTATPTPTPTAVPKDPSKSSTGGSEQNKPSPTGEIFTGVTATPTPKPNQATATPTQKPTATPTPMKSTKEEPTNSTNDDLDTSKKVFEEANNEPTVKPTPQVTEVEDCENPGSKKKATGQVDDNLEKDEQANKKAATPSPTPKLAQTEDGKDIDDTPSGSWGRSGR